MGLDVYAGTFTRYYARNWKTATQKFSEENGISFWQIRADNTPQPPDGEICLFNFMAGDGICRKGKSAGYSGFLTHGIYI